MKGTEWKPTHLLLLTQVLQVIFQPRTILDGVDGREFAEDGVSSHFLRL